MYSAFAITALHAITIVLAFAGAYFFNRNKLNLWRVVVGFIAGFVASWVPGVIVWAAVFMSSDVYSAIVIGMPKSFLVAIFGSVLGVYIGRRQAKLKFSNSSWEKSSIR